MAKQVKMDSLVAVQGGQSYIGKLFYFTIGKCIIPENQFEEIVKRCGIPSKYLTKQYANSQAFRTATKYMEQKRKTYINGFLEIHNIRILDNKKEDDGNILVREIKKEVIDERENKMLSLGNFQYDKDKDVISYSLNSTNINSVDFDLQKECDNVISSYHHIKHCYTESRIITLVENFIDKELEASPININGKLFFVPIYKNKELLKLEQLLMEIQDANELKDSIINSAAIPVMNEAKFVKEYSKEYYAMASKELEFMQQRFDHFIQNGQSNSKIIDNYTQKIQKYLDRKKNYEETFQTELNNLDDDFAIIERQLREISIRSSNFVNDNQLKIVI